MQKLENWIKAIPESNAHGSGTLEKRLWRLVSDYVRIRDWYRWNKSCVATGAFIPEWKLGQAGHYKSYNACDGMFKFDEMNIHLQSASSNAWGDQEIGYKFGEELKRRYGADYLERITLENRKHISEKRDTFAVKEKIGEMILKMEQLPEQPDYYERAKKLYYESLE